jgi:DNA-binding SARP family transcriptional activator/tetratricopeptide (TPR) repeat protein
MAFGVTSTCPQRGPCSTLERRRALTLLEVSLLGEQYVEGSTATNLARSSRSIALLGFLAVHAEAPQPRQRLAAIFWPDSSEQQARTNLRRELHYLRVLLGEDPSLVVEPATLMWREWPTCHVDVCVFRRERQLTLQALAAGDQHAMLEHGAAAVEEYRGDLLPGMYDDWVLVERDELRRQCVELCDQLVAGWRDLGDLKKAVEYGRIRVRLEPLEEPGYRTLMELQADAGDRAGAISTYHKCAEILEHELQVKPSQATETLAERLLSSDSLDMSRTRGPRHARTRLTQRARLVGREREFDQVLESWNNVVDGRPRLLVVTGDAGVGKSRLISELAHQARTDGAVVATTRCFGMAGTLALKPAADWLRHPRVQRSLTTLDAASRAEVDRLIPGAAGDIDGGKRERPLPEPVAASRAMVDAWRRHRFFEGLARGILAVGQPTLLVLDDLHWCDEETAAWLPFLLGRAAGAPLLIAATARREELTANAEVSRMLLALRSAGSLIEMPLPPLGREGVRALAASFLERELSDEEVSLLVTATGGYPLYVVEAIRSASELDSDRPLSSFADLSSVLRSRLEAASPHAREVASLASAVGRDFTLDLLTEASDLDVDAVVRSVDELWRQGIFREQPTGYDFSHDLVRDAAYASVSPPHRWLLHRRIAQSLQILNADHDDDVAAQLAEQYDRGGRPDRARHYYRRAAQLAAAVFANTEAVRCFRRCLELIAQQPAGRARDDEELDVLLEMAPPLNAIHGYSSSQLQATLERSAHLAEKLSRLRDLTSCFFGLAAVRFVQGHVTDAYLFGTRGLEVAGAEPKTAGQAHLMVAGPLTSLGRLDEALTHFERCRELSRGAVSAIMGTLPEVHGLAWSAHAHWLLGNPEQALTRCWEAVGLARSADHPYSLAVALGYLATTHQLVHDRAAAGEAASELINLCERYSFSYYGQWGVVVDGWVRGGEAGVVRIQQGIDTLRLAGQNARMPYWLYLLADVMMQAGRTAAARGILDAALAAAEQQDERWWLPEVLRARARLLSRDAAVPILRQAALLAKEQHSRVLQARCEQDLAELGDAIEDGVLSPGR